MNIMLQTLHHMQPNPNSQQPQAPPPPQSKLGGFLKTRLTTFSQAKDSMEVEDSLKAIEKKLLIA
jgi:hypothetical protein